MSHVTDEDATFVRDTIETLLVERKAARRQIAKLSQEVDSLYDLLDRERQDHAETKRKLENAVFLIGGGVSS